MYLSLGLFGCFLMLEVMSCGRNPKRGVPSSERCFLGLLMLIGHITGDTSLEYTLEWFLLDFPSPGTIEPSFRQS